MGRKKRGRKPGRSPESKPWTLKEIGGKSVWDWMQLLIVPLLLLVLSGLFAWQQNSRQEAIDQNAALQAYLDQMSTLLIEKDLRNSEIPSEARTLARARTLTVLEGLDASRRTQVLRFLMEAGLVQSRGDQAPIISLREANLQGVTLAGALLPGADLHMANLSDAYLVGADLRGAYLFSADLSGADLSSGQGDPPGALLNNANLGYANLSDANLRQADLRGADLRNAQGITTDQLEDQARYLEGAMMPDGKEHP